MNQRQTSLFLPRLLLQGLFSQLPEAKALPSPAGSRTTLNSSVTSSKIHFVLGTGGRTFITF